MRTEADFENLVPCDEMRGDGRLDMRLLRGMLKEAQNYLLSFHWCLGLAKCYFGLGVGGVVAVFLFKILPKRRTIDKWLWVVVGDLPPAYLVVDNSPTPVDALENYIAEMRKWASAAKAGKSVKKFIPVNAEPNPENAVRLQKRLDFLGKEIVAPGKQHAGHRRQSHR